MRISVGIPAYNEEGNIRSLLEQICSQEETGFVIEEILVFSDGSSDRTVAEAESVSDPRIRVYEDGQRKGKMHRFTELQRIFKGDALVQFDADIKLSDNKVIHHLVETLLLENADVVCTNSIPVLPHTLAEKVAYFGVQSWFKVVKNMGEKELYHRCIGAGRIFTRKFLEAFKPQTNVSGEDVFCFLWAVTNNYKVAFARKATIYYRMPASFGDFLKQSRRFLVTPLYMEQYYPVSLIAQYQPTFWRKMRVLSGAALKTWPHILFLYCIMQAYARSTAKTTDAQTLWQMATSTKKFVK